MELIRNVLTKSECKKWFEEHGPNFKEPLTFEKVFGDTSKGLKEKPDDVFTFTVIDGVMFIREQIVSWDVFMETSQNVFLDRYIIIPQIGMYV